MKRARQRLARRRSRHLPPQSVLASTQTVGGRADPDRRVPPRGLDEGTEAQTSWAHGRPPRDETSSRTSSDFLQLQAGGPTGQPATARSRTFVYQLHMDDRARMDLSERDRQHAQNRLALEFGSREEFEDPRFAYRRLFAEALGTFLLVLAAAGGGVLHARGQISLSAAVVAPGLTVMAVILSMGAVSGAHLNPVVSIAFALRHDFPWKRVPRYVLAQLTGATLAALFLLALFGNVQHLGATLPGHEYHPWQAFLLEVALTSGLVSVILGTASRAQNVGSVGALGVGGYVALAGLWSAPVSGASMNPARSFGPALVSGDWSAYWVYVAGPLIGASIAVGAAVILRGRGGDPTARAAASGRLGL